MRLISCYIENFGGLSKYSLEFQPGLTVVNQPNGFGKTTLAEFIRAMFYGFPRANKSLEKNSRKKYAPWQGGKFGGNLVFEHEGREYRIERTFGKTPRSDTFTLYEMNPMRKSDRFSENIGLELFRLDSDSFERSTYLPQLFGTGTLSTNNIQAKLGDLVEDVNDINNYDKAVEALRAKRSSLQAYRGSGGTIAQAQGRIYELQRELDREKSLPDDLARARERASTLDQEQQKNHKEWERIRREIGARSEALARAAKREQYKDLCRRQEVAQKALLDLEGRYPLGVPEPEAVQEIVPVADQAALLARPLEKTPAEKEAEATLARLQSQFCQGLPEDGDFARCRQDYDAYIGAESALGNLHLTEGEKSRLGELEAFFAPGVPSEDTISALQEKQERLARLEAQAAALRLSEEDARQLEQLEAYFAPGLPREEDLEKARENWARVGALRQENERIAAQAPQKPKPKTWALPALLLGILALALGTGLLFAKKYAAGAVALVAGVLLLLGAVYLRLKQMVFSGVSGTTDNRQELLDLEEGIRDILGPYRKEGDNLGEQVSVLSGKIQAYGVLKWRQTAIQESRDKLRLEIETLTQGLEAGLSPYFSGDSRRKLGELSDRRREYLSLTVKETELQETREQRKKSLEKQAEKISAFLAAYGLEAEPKEFGHSLTRLQRDCDAYRQAQRLIENSRRQTEQRETRLAECRTRLREFTRHYGLDDGLPDMQELREDARRYKELCQRLTAETQAAETFFEENQAMLEESEAPAQQNLEELKAAEEAFRREIQVKEQERLELTQEIRSLQRQAEELPRKQDVLEALLLQKEQDSANCTLLDKTMELMEKAKDDLNNRYLGPIKGQFQHYMEAITGKEGERVNIDPNLNVYLERYGENRELTYFSAGQTDAIQLCMRLALVDALFTEAKPFLILDDPFVNLDDQRTTKALELLKTLAGEHQIIYLVCNSSRTF